MKQYKQQKQLDDTWVVERRFKIPSLINRGESKIVEDSLEDLPGIRQITIDTNKHQLILHYDVTVLGYGAILKCLDSTGHPLKGGLLSKWKKSWCEFTEANAKDNAKAPPPACCNKPPK